VIIPYYIMYIIVGVDMANKEVTFLNDIDENKVNELLDTTSNNVAYFNKVFSNVTKTYSESLDNLMSDLYVECIKNKNADTKTLEKYFLELANMLYFMAEKLEELGIYDDMSKSAAKEVYSKAYLDNQVKEVSGKNKTTIAELQATAELEAQYPLVVNNIYSRAYSTLKNKINSAQDMLSTLRKIISGRQIEMNSDNNLNFSSKNFKGE